jgi:hypothetical protein
MKPPLAANREPQDDHRQGGCQREQCARPPDRDRTDHQGTPSEARDRAAESEHGRAACEVGDEDRAEQRRRQAEWRCSEQEVHVGEQRDEREQRAEADRVGGKQLRSAQVAQHLAA